MGFNLSVKITSRPCERGMFTRDQRGFPFVPDGAALGRFEGAKERVIIKPRSTLFREGFKLIAKLRVVRSLIVRERFVQNQLLRFMNLVKVDALGRQRRDFIQVCSGEQSCLEKFLGTYQQSIPGKRRIARVRRIAIAGRTERQNLPKTLAAGHQKVCEAIGVVT